MKHVLSGLSGWCVTGHHNDCPRKFEHFYMDRGKVVKTGHITYCTCKFKSCECKKNPRNTND